MEFRAVFRLLVEGLKPHEKGMDTVAEERRLFYVAMTRASEKALSFCNSCKDMKKERCPRFLAEMGLMQRWRSAKIRRKKENKR